MAVIENEIQYNWVRKRVSKLKEKVDENTPTNNPYRIELELLSKLEKEYSEEHVAVLETTPKNICKKQINIYEGLPIILEKVKSVALSAVIGKSNSWLNQKLVHYVVKGRMQEFYPDDLPLLNDGIARLGDEILNNLVVHDTDRDIVIVRMKTLAKMLCMPYIYGEVLKKKACWYTNRTKRRCPDGRASSFSEGDVLAINMAAMQVANELKSIELVL